MRRGCDNEATGCDPPTFLGREPFLRANPGAPDGPARQTPDMSSTAASPDRPVDPLHRTARLNLQEFARELARWSGASGEVVERDGLLLYATATAFPVTCNGVFRLEREVPDEVVLDVADAWFGERSRGYTLQLEDRSGADATLAAAALDRGLLPVGDSPVMVCRERLDDPAPTSDIELRWVTDHADVRDFVAVSDTAYQSLGMTPGVITEMTLDLDRLLEPHLAQVVAHDAGRPVAAAQLLLSHGIAGVYYVGTVEAARGKGLGELVTRAVTNRGFDAGAAFVCLQATAMGEPVYRRMGYQEIGRYEGFVRFT